MDKDTAKGRGKQIAGKAREIAGKATGNEEQEAKGKGDQMEGKVQRTYGDAKEKVKDIGRAARGK